MDRQIEVMPIVMNGFNAFVRKSLRLTFNPRPTMAAVKIQVVAVLTPSKSFTGRGKMLPST